MRLLKYEGNGCLTLTPDLYAEDIPPYAILSHTWGTDEQEVDYHDMINRSGTHKSGYDKLMFCAQQADLDGVQHTWVDTCCINKDSSTELTEAINSMFRWYQKAVKCYVYLADVAATARVPTDVDFGDSRWFTRGWTLQELLAPKSVQFFTRDRKLLGDKIGLAHQIAEITGIPSKVLRDGQFMAFDIEERISWSYRRRTKRAEDKAYSLLGIVGVQMSPIYGEGCEKALDRLRRKVKKTQSPTKERAQTGNVHWVVAKTENKLFTGRAELFYRMQDAFHADGDDGITQQTRLVITGLGGQGKSEVCIRFANLVREDFWGVFWVDVSNESTAHNGFMAIAKALRSPAETIEELLPILATITKPWLLILDNADDPTFDYTAYFPRGKTGAIIMTSRIAESKKYSTARSESLGGLDLALSTQLLLKAAYVPEAEWPKHIKEAENIADLLGSHTLALIQAGAYIAGGHCRFNQYAERYRRHRKQLLQHHPNQHHSRYQNVLATFEASLGAIKHLGSETGKDAIDLLGILSMLHHTVLPQQLFHDARVGARTILHRGSHNTATHQGQQTPHQTRRLLSIWKRSKRVRALPEMPESPRTRDIRVLGREHVSRLPDFLGHSIENWDDSRIEEAFGLLLSLSLVTRLESNGYIGWSMHPVAHTWAKDRLEESQKKHAWIHTACLCAFSLVCSNTWIVRQIELRPHIRSLVSPGLDTLFLYAPRPFMLPLVVHCGWLLETVREHKTLQTLLDGTYRAVGISPRDMAEEYMPFWRLAALASLFLRQLKLAIHLSKYIISIEATTLNDSDPNRLSSQYNLARAYNDDGQPENAIPLLENIIKLYKTLPTHQGWLLWSQIELSRAYTVTNRYHEAVLLSEQVVQHRQSMTGPTAQHYLLNSQLNLASSYMNNDQNRDAIDLLEHVVTIYESFLEESHHDRLSAQYTLALAYVVDDRQSDAAFKILKHVEKIQKNTLEESNVSLLLTRQLIGKMLLARGEVKEALDLLEHVVDIYAIVMNEGQPERLAAQYDLARVYVETGELDKTTELVRHVVEHRRKAFDKEHPLMVVTEGFWESLVAGTVYD